MTNKPKLPVELEQFINAHLTLCAIADLTLKADTLSIPEDLKVEWFMSELSGLVKPRMAKSEYLEVIKSFEGLNWRSIEQCVMEMIITGASCLQDYLRDEIDYF
jgi:hypothetical protein